MGVKAMPKNLSQSRTFSTRHRTTTLDSGLLHACSFLNTISFLMSGIKPRGGHVRVQRRSQVICCFDVRIFCNCGKCRCSGFRRNAQSARQSGGALSELPHSERMETNPRSSGIRPQPDEISSARHAPVGELHSMSRQAGFHQCWATLPGLPRRHSQAATGSELRAMPHRPWMASLHSAGAAA